MGLRDCTLPWTAVHAPLVGVLVETLAWSATWAQAVLATSSTEDRVRAYGPVNWQGGAAKRMRAQGGEAYLLADRLPVACHRGLAP